MTPHRAHRARGCSWDMRLGREITAARQRASRLAGLVRLPAAWQTQTAIRRQASWLAIKASVDLISRWPLALQKYPSYAEATHHARCAPAYRHPGKGKAAHSSPPQKSPRCTEAYHPARGKPAPRRLREKENQPIHLRCKNPQATPQHPTPQGVSLPTANCGGAERR